MPLTVLNNSDNEHAALCDQYYNNIISMWQSQVENEHYSTVSGLIQVVL